MCKGDNLLFNLNGVGFICGGLLMWKVLKGVLIWGVYGGWVLLGFNWYMEVVDIEKFVMYVSIIINFWLYWLLFICLVFFWMSKKVKNWVCK